MAWRWTEDKPISEPMGVVDMIWTSPILQNYTEYNSATVHGLDWLSGTYMHHSNSAPYPYIYLAFNNYFICHQQGKDNLKFSWFPSTYLCFASLLFRLLKALILYLCDLFTQTLQACFIGIRTFMWWPQCKLNNWKNISKIHDSKSPQNPPRFTQSSWLMMTKWHQGPLLLTRLNFNPSMDNYIYYIGWEESTNPFPNSTDAPLKFGNG